MGLLDAATGNTWGFHKAGSNARPTLIQSQSDSRVASAKSAAFSSCPDRTPEPQFLAFISLKILFGYVYVCTVFMISRLKMLGSLQQKMIRTLKEIIPCTYER